MRNILAGPRCYEDTLKITAAGPRYHTMKVSTTDPKSGEAGSSHSVQATLGAKIESSGKTMTDKVPRRMVLTQSHGYLNKVRSEFPKVGGSAHIQSQAPPFHKDLMSKVSDPWHRMSSGTTLLWFVVWLHRFLNPKGRTRLAVSQTRAFIRTWPKHLHTSGSSPQAQIWPAF